jgi:hypothetical protein
VVLAFGTSYAIIGGFSSEIACCRRWRAAALQRGHTEDFDQTAVAKEMSTRDAPGEDLADKTTTLYGQCDGKWGPYTPGIGDAEHTRSYTPPLNDIIIRVYGPRLRLCLRFFQ